MKQISPILLLLLLAFTPSLALDVRDFGALGDGRDIVVESQDSSITELSPRSAQLQVADEVGLEPRLLVDTPGS